MIDVSTRPTKSGDEASDLFSYLAAVVADLGLAIEQRDGRITVKAPCGSPLGLWLEPLDDQIFAYFLCRSTSWHWDGERTDVHDLFSIYLATRLATAGLASCALVDAPHPAVYVPGELYARYIIPIQPHRGWYTDNADGRAELADLISVLNDVEYELHSLGGPCNDSEEMGFSIDDDVLNRWGSDISEALNVTDGDPDSGPLLYARTNPDWLYYRTVTGDQSLAQSWGLGMLFRVSVQGDSDEKQGTSARLVRRGALQNACKDEDLAYVKHLLEELEFHDSANVRAIPLEDCLVVTSGPNICMIRTNAGEDAYAVEVEATLRQNDSFLAWARPSVEFEWAVPVDATPFEQLTYDLLSAEPNVRRVRFVGSTNDGDGGRDLLVDMVTPLTRQEIEAGAAQGDNILVPRRVLAQCKTKRDPKKGIGKADVRDIRDTIERYEADGYWLFASSHITAQLVEHLEVLERKYQYVNWWTRREIEDVLRRSPRLIDAHADVVTRV